LISCKKTATEPEEQSLFGRWSFSNWKVNYTITTTSNQTAKLPYSGIGTVKIQSTTATHLNAIFIASYNPVIIGLMAIEDDNTLSATLYIDDNTKTATVYYGFPYKIYEGAIDYTFNGNEVIANKSTLTNVDDASDTITVDGLIAFEILNIEANTPTTIDIPAFQTQREGTLEYDFGDDGTFTQTIINTDGSTETDLGTWVSTGDEITMTWNDNIDETFIDIYEYSIINNNLELKQETDACSGGGDYLYCLNVYEDFYQLDHQSVTEVRTESTFDFSRVNEL